jgi:hypothetical protein
MEHSRDERTCSIALRFSSSNTYDRTLNSRGEEMTLSDKLGELNCRWRPTHPISHPIKNLRSRLGIYKDVRQTTFVTAFPRRDLWPPHSQQPQGLPQANLIAPRVAYGPLKIRKSTRPARNAASYFEEWPFCAGAAAEGPMHAIDATRVQEGSLSLPRFSWSSPGGSIACASLNSRSMWTKKSKNDALDTLLLRPTTFPDHNT